VSKRNRLFSFNSHSLLKARVNVVVEDKSKTVGSAPSPFDEHAMPTLEQVRAAASLYVVAESGVRVRFGELWEGEQTVVIFLRHFRASACQDYVRSIASDVNVDILRRAGLKIVLLGIGSHTFITPYRNVTGTRLPIFTDPSCSLHRALGMTLKTTYPGPDSERGHYVTYGTLGSIRRTLTDVITRKLPVFERGGDITQLGGEFIFGPGMACAFAHRMKHTRAHRSILDLAATAAAGSPKPPLSTGTSNGIVIDIKKHALQRLSHASAVEDEEAWMAQRRASLARLKKKRRSRRTGERVPGQGRWTDGEGETFEEFKGRLTVFEEDGDGEREEGIDRDAGKMFDLKLEFH